MIRLLILLGVLFFMDWYALQAIFPFLQHEDHRIWVCLINYMIPILILFSMLIFRQDSTRIGKRRAFLTLLRSSLIGFYIAKFLLFIFVLLDDLRRLLILIMCQMSSNHMMVERSGMWLKAGIILSSLLFLILLYGMLRNQYRYQVKRLKLSFPNWPNALHGLKILQISDIHSGSFNNLDAVKKGVEKINKQEADIVFFTGDLVNNVAEEIAPFEHIFSQVKSKHGVWSILGNHDYGDYVRWTSQEEKKQNLRNLIAAHRRMGWEILLNENEIITINDAQLAIIGVENYSADKRFSKYGDLQKSIRGTENEAARILLSHDPSHWIDQVVDAHPTIGLTLSGHTHGFQFGIELGDWFKWSPVQYVYKQWAGLYQRGQQYLYVNRGFGFLGYPGRVGILAEITVIEIDCK